MRSARLAYDYDELTAFMTWFRGLGTKMIAVDTETEGLDHWRHRLRLVQVSDGVDAWAVDALRWPGITQEIERHPGEVVFHNGIFDYKFLGWKRPYHDTLLMSNCVDPRGIGGRHGLKILGNLVDPSDAANRYQKRLDADMARYKWGWDTVPIDWPAYWEYGCYDTWLTWKLAEMWMPQVRGSSTYDLERAVAHVLRDMECKGMAVDRSYVHRTHDALSAQIEELAVRVLEEFNCEAGSVQQVVAALLREGAPIPSWAKTPKGAVSLTAEVLELIDHDLARWVLEHRRLVKVRSTWFESFRDCLTPYDVVHPSIRALGARTGRMSITQPALQTLPRGPIVRDCITAREGNWLVMADYKQAELRVLAHFADDEAMIAAFTADEDLHQALADEAGCSRQSAKSAWFARVYGAGLETFSRTAGVTQQEGQGILDAMDRRFPGIRRFLREVEDVAARRLAQDGIAWVRTPYGRLQVADMFYEYKLGNYLIQATATADLTKTKLVELDAAGWGEYLVLPMHDEVILDVPEDLVETARKEVPEIMQDLTTFKVPMLVDVEVFDRWGSKYAQKIPNPYERLLTGERRSYEEVAT